MLSLFRYIFVASSRNALLIDRDFSHYSHGENALFVQNRKLERELPQAAPSQALPRQLPQRGSQDLKPVAKVLDAMRKFPVVLLALPLGELAKPTGFD